MAKFVHAFTSDCCTFISNTRRGGHRESVQFVCTVYGGTREEFIVDCEHLVPAAQLRNHDTHTPMCMVGTSACSHAYGCISSRLLFAIGSSSVHLTSFGHLEGFTARLVQMFDEHVQIAHIGDGLPLELYVGAGPTHLVAFADQRRLAFDECNTLLFVLGIQSINLHLHTPYHRGQDSHDGYVLLRNSSVPERTFVRSDRLSIESSVMECAVDKNIL